ncbi:hypothetical protein BpHYR1_007338 [Brachionus plicatilis]|uniref:Uncharacterized protein n=1 Tax=Brachionus plicatilis TaxID=10195 RepID=A0A3M7SJ48_BRAPC|nr:hypothetical protein BpHYR1_007338 [Brachionus plicatilis]
MGYNTGSQGQSKQLNSLNNATKQSAAEVHSQNVQLNNVDLMNTSKNSNGRNLPISNNQDIPEASNIDIQNTQNTNNNLNQSSAHNNENISTQSSNNELIEDNNSYRPYYKKKTNKKYKTRKKGLVQNFSPRKSSRQTKPPNRFIPT